MKRISLLLALLIFLPFSFAQLNLTVTRALNLEMNTTCPGNVLHVYAIASDGTPVPDAELRLVLYEPYLGLRALQHTDQTGYASFELKATGYYQIYVRVENDTYNHPNYFDFNYTAMCPPPPPKKLSVEISKNCASGVLVLNISSGSGPESNVLVTSPQWSSLSGSDGSAVIPFQQGYVLLHLEKVGYTGINISERILCSGCLADFDCADDEQCDNSSSNCVPVNAAGPCGFFFDHAWYPYQCCGDSDCGNGSGLACLNNSCVTIPPTPQITNNQTNGSIQNGSIQNGTNASAGNANNTNASGTNANGVGANITNANGTNASAGNAYNANESSAGSTGAGGSICSSSAVLFAITAAFSSFIIFLHKK